MRRAITAWHDTTIGVSIHAPGRGATASAVVLSRSFYVSIHAPGRGATTASRYFLKSDCFNSRTREGCDLSRVRFSVCALEFQFTHPGGVRLVPDSDYSAVGMFQFTHPGGVRRSADRCLAISLTFQFTHPGGVRPNARKQGASYSEFQFTHPGGVRPRLTGRTTLLRLSFNSRTREGCD